MDPTETKSSKLSDSLLRRHSLMAFFLIAFCILVNWEIFISRAFGPEFCLYYYYNDGATWATAYHNYSYLSMAWYRPTGTLPYWLVQKVVDWHNVAGWRLVNTITWGVTAWLVYMVSLELFP